MKIKKLKIKKKIKSSDRVLRIFALIFVVGYAFFFSSNLFFPKIYKGLDTAYIGQVMDLREAVFTLDSWDYSETDDMFEILLDIKNLSLDEKPKYNFQIFTKNKNIKGEVIKIIDDKLIVVRFSGIPNRWTEAKLTIEAGDNLYRLGMNDKKVHLVSDIKERSDKEYLEYSKLSKIDGLKEFISAEEKEVRKLDKKLNYAYTKIEELEKGKENQTEKEIEITNNNISKISADAENIKGQIDTKMIDIEDAKERIKILEGSK